MRWAYPAEGRLEMLAMAAMEHSRACERVFVVCTVPARACVGYCDHAQPVYFDSAAHVDQTPASIRRQVLEWNEMWAKLCRP